MTEPIDTSTLAWVQSEATSGIDRIRESLDRFVADISDMTPLRVAGAEIRQLSGALKLHELDYSADVADELDRLIGNAANSGNSKRAESSLVFIHHGLDVLGAIVGRLQVTGRDNQLATISIINELRAVRGAELIDLASVFKPDIQLPLPDDVEAQPVETVDTSAERRQFQEYLLAWVNNKGSDNVLEQMALVFGHLRSGAGAQQWRRLWWIAEAFTETRGYSVTLSDRTAVALFRRLDQHIRRFDEAGSTADIDDDLVVNLLFAVLVSERRDGVAGRVIDTFNLLDAGPEKEQNGAIFSVNRDSGEVGATERHGEQEVFSETGSEVTDAHELNSEIDSFLTEVQPDIRSSANLIETMLTSESVAPESVAQLRLVLSELNRSENGKRLGAVGTLVNELDLCLNAVHKPGLEITRALQLRIANSLMLLQRLAADEIDLQDSEEELVATSRYLRKEYIQTTSTASSSPLSKTDDDASRLIDGSVVPGRFLSTPMLAQPVQQFDDGDVGVLERPDNEREIPRATDRSGNTDDAESGASQPDQSTISVSTRTTTPVSTAASTGNGDSTPTPTPEWWLAAHIQAVKKVLAEFSSSHINDESRAQMSERMDEIVGLLDELGHTSAGDVFDYCRRVVAGLISGRLVSQGSIVASVDAGIVAVERHVGLGDHSSTPLELESLTEAEQVLREQLASARAKVVPLDTMRQNLMDFLVEWRRADSTRDDWRNYRTALDDIKAFAEFNNQSDLGQRINTLMDVSAELMGRLSNPDQQDIDRLGRARDSVLVALARRANREPDQPRVDTVRAEDTVFEAPSPDTPVETENAVSMSITSTIAGKTLQHVRQSLARLSASPGDRDQVSEVALGLLLVREKCENNGARAATEVARIGEKLMGEVATQVVPVTPALDQFLRVACDKIDDLTGIDPLSDGEADLDAWKQAAANVRIGKDPLPCLGEEAIFIDDGLVDASPLEISPPPESNSETDEDDPAMDSVDESAGVRFDQNENQTVVSAGVLAQQVLANVGMDVSGETVVAAASASDNAKSKIEDDRPAEPDRADSAEQRQPNDVLFDSTASGSADTKTQLSIDPHVDDPQTENREADNQQVAAQSAAVVPEHRLSAPRTASQPPELHGDSDSPSLAAEMSPAGRRADGENVDVMIGEAMAHTAYLGQWVEQYSNADDVCSVSEDLSSAVNVLRAITRVIGVDSVAAPFEPLHGLLELMRKESLPLAAAERNFVKRTGKLTEASLLVLSENDVVSEEQQREMKRLAAQLDARLLELESQISEQGSQNPEQIPIKIIGDDIVTLEQLAGGQSNDQLDLDRLFREESSELCKRIREATGRWREESFSRDARSDLLHEFHTLKGNARTAGFPEAAALAHSLETLLGQQNPNQQGQGLHGEEVVIYLNQAATVLTEFIDQPDSERSRDALEALKRRVDAQCFNDSEPAVLAVGENPLLMPPTPPQPDNDHPAQEQTAGTRDLATIASTSYAYDGFVEKNLESETPVQIDEVARKTASASVPVTAPIVLDRIEPERTLPNSLMAPATVITESGGPTEDNYDDIEEFETPAAQLVQPTEDAASVATELVEKVADNLGDIQGMSRSLTVDLEKLTELNDEYDTRLSRVLERLNGLQGPSSESRAADEFSHSSVDEIQTELSGLNRLHEHVVTATSKLRDVVDRHDDRVANLRDELKRLRGVAFETVAPRLRLVVRQSSSQLLKETRFVLRGGEVEIDRHIVESLLGSLENLLRNAVVHGIEFPERRRQSGKSPTGVVQISVRRDLEDLVIEVSDDGAGIDYSALGQLVDQSRAESGESDDEEIDQRLLTDRMFDAGVTTASDVTELAGRGVGLDVVRKTVGLLGGNVEVRSEPGRGSSFVIRLPVQAETLKARIIDAGDYCVAVAEHHVKAAVSVLTSDLDRLVDTDNQTIEVDGRIYPFLKLREALKLAANDDADLQPNITVLLLQLSHGEVALEIEGTNTIAQVVRQPRKAGNRKPAMVLATFSAIDWLDIDALWSQSAVYSMGERVQRAFQFGRDDNRKALERAELVTKRQFDVESGQESRLANRSVIFVADSRDIAPELIAELEARKMTIEIVSRSAVAIELLENSPVHAIVVDLDLPGGDGFELVHQLSKLVNFSDLPTIVVSSVEDEFRRKRLDSLKVTEVVAKPCDNEKLIQIIESLQGPRYSD